MQQVVIEAHGSNAMVLHSLGFITQAIKKAKPTQTKTEVWGFSYIKTLVVIRDSCGSFQVSQKAGYICPFTD